MSAATSVRRAPGPKYLPHSRTQAYAPVDSHSLKLVEAGQTSTETSTCSESPRLSLVTTPTTSKEARFPNPQPRRFLAPGSQASSTYAAAANSLVTPPSDGTEAPTSAAVPSFFILTCNTPKTNGTIIQDCIIVPIFNNFK